MLIKLSSGFSYRAGPPASIDFTNAPAVTPATLLGIVDTTRGVEVYVADDDVLGGQWQGRVLVLFGAPPSVTNADQLLVFLNDGRTAAGDDTLSAFEAQAHADALAALAVLDVLATDNTLKGVGDDVNNFSARNHADQQQLDSDLNSFSARNHGDLTKLDADLNTAAATAHADSGKLDTDLNSFAAANHTDVTAASNRNHADLVQVDTDLNAASALAHGDSGRLDTDLNTFAGANHADLGRIEALLAAQRQETLWTDDSRAYFVRLDTRGAITWTDLSGNAGPAPGVGVRPASGDDALLDKSSYQAINAGTGYAAGDLVDHVITTDPKSGAIVGHFWLNLSQETTIAAPAPLDLEPLSRLPDDASRASLQSSIGVTAHADAQKLDTDLVAGFVQNHTDLTTLDGDLRSAATQNHTDLVTLDTDLKAAGTLAHGDSQKLDQDLNGFATATHTDLSTLDTDLKAGSAQNHSDLTAANTTLTALSTVTGTQGDAPAADDVAAASIVSLLRRGLGRWTTFLGRFPAALGATAAAGSLSVTLATDGVFVTNVGAKEDAAATTDVDAWSIVSLIKRGLQNWTSALALLALTRVFKTAPQANAQAIDQSGPLSAVGDTVAVLANGMNTGVVRLPSGWTGSVVVEGTADGASYDVPLSVQLFATSGNTGALATLTAAGVYEVNITGLAGFRVRATTAITGGPITALVRAASGVKSSRVGAPSGNPVPVYTPPGTVTQTIVSAASGLLIAANPARKSLRWMVTGAADITVAPGVNAPAAGQGMIYQASALGAGKQGASESFVEGAMATNAFAFVASAATTVVVWECY